MNRSRLLLIGLIALAAGGFVSYVVYRSLPGQGSSANLPGVEALVAARDIQVGSKLEDADITTARFLPGSLPPEAYKAKEKEKVLGRGAILPMTKGEFILPDKLAGENAGSGLPSLIPPGMRAVSVRTNEVVSVAGFVAPGTRVDVLYTSSQAGASEPVTTTLLENVLVIAAGGRLERSGATEAQTVPVVTLLVSPDDAQKLAMAQQEGKIQLSLRSPLDTDQETPDVLAKGSLYRGAPVPVTEQKPRPHAVKKAPAPTPVGPYKVEIIRGNKVDKAEFPQEPLKEQ